MCGARSDMHMIGFFTDKIFVKATGSISAVNKVARRRMVGQGTVWPSIHIRVIQSRLGRSCQVSVAGCASSHHGRAKTCREGAGYSEKLVESSILLDDKSNKVEVEYKGKQD